MKGDLCRQFQSEALRLGLWHMNSVVPEAQFSLKHLSLDLKCRQIKTIDHLLSIPAGFPTDSELRPLHTLPFSFVTLALSQPRYLFLHSFRSHILHIQSISSAVLYASKMLLHSAFFLFTPEGDFRVWAVISPCFHYCRTLFQVHIFTVFFLGKIFQSKL